MMTHMPSRRARNILEIYSNLFAPKSNNTLAKTLHGIALLSMKGAADKEEYKEEKYDQLRAIAAAEQRAKEKAAREDEIEAKKHAYQLERDRYHETQEDKRYARKLQDRAEGRRAQEANYERSRRDAEAAEERRRRLMLDDEQRREKQKLQHTITSDRLKAFRGKDEAAARRYAENPSKFNIRERSFLEKVRKFNNPFKTDYEIKEKKR